MYMIKVYEFRADLSNQFNKALAGEQVFIERGGVTFQLTVVSSLPTPPVVEKAPESQPKAVPVTGPKIEQLPDGAHAIVISRRDAARVKKAVATETGVTLKDPLKKIPTSATPMTLLPPLKLSPAKIQDRGLCKNGHILNRMGRCDVKGCKYA